VRKGKLFGSVHDEGRRVQTDIETSNNTDIAPAYLHLLVIGYFSWLQKMVHLFSGWLFSGCVGVPVGSIGLKPICFAISLSLVCIGWNVRK
jgi:hypothetical protein